MKLTGKCKEDFEKQITTDRSLELHLPDVYLNALIINFFDTVVYKGNPLFNFCFEFFWKHKSDSQTFNDVCLQAIEKANDLYNSTEK